MDKMSIEEVTKAICDTLDALVQLAKVQQAQMGNGEFEDFDATFVRRQALFTELANLNNIFLELEQKVKHHQSKQIELYRAQIKERIEQVIENDQKVSLLIGIHMERLGFTLLNRWKLREAMKDYKETAQTTNLVGRLFGDKTRYINLKK